MPGINLDGLRVAEVRPTVGTLERTPVTRPDYTGLLSAVGSGVSKLLNSGEDKAEQQAALAIVDESLRQQEGTSFQADKEPDAGVGAAQKVEADTGIALDAGDKASLSSAAATGMRLNDAQSNSPDGERRFNLIRTRELRKLIADRPHLAKEYRSLLYGDNNFITASFDDTEKAAAAEANERFKMIAKAQDIAFQSGYHEVANMSQAQFLSWQKESGLADEFRNLGEAERELKALKAMQERGQVVPQINLDRVYAKGRPGLTRAAMVDFDTIIKNPTLSVADKQRAITASVIERQGRLLNMIPGITPEQLNIKFKDILVDLPNIYKELAGEGPERDAAKIRLELIQLHTGLRMEEQYGQSEVEAFAKVVGALEPTGVLSNFDILKDGRPMQRWLQGVMASKYGDNHPAPRLTQRPDKQFAEETEQDAAFVRRMLGGFDKLDTDSRKATAGMVVSAILHPDNRRSDAGMDRLMTLMASPDFKPLAESQEWKDMVATPAADRAIGLYLRNLNTAVGNVVGPLAGKVNLKLDDQGVLTFVPTPGLAPKDRDVLARVQNRLRTAIFANANLHGQTPAEASKDFYDSYLAR